MCSHVMPPRPILPLLCAVLLGGSTAILRPAPGHAAVDPRFFPPSSVFRELQLTTLGCGRENSEDVCGEARRAADELLDHPLLPASCKDTLWTITRTASVAPANSYERRSAIDRAARDLTVLCRSLPARPEGQDGARPGAPGAAPAAPATP